MLCLEILMTKIDKTVLKETKYIALWVIILSVLMNAVFLIIGKWDYKVLLGTLLGDIAAIGNFFLMGLTVQKAVLKEEKEAKKLMRISQIYRNLLILVIIVVGIFVPVFNKWAVIIPIFFPRISILFRPLFNKKAD